MSTGSNVGVESFFAALRPQTTAIDSMNEALGLRFASASVQRAAALP